MKDKITLSYNLKAPLVNSSQNLLNTDFWRFLVELTNVINNSDVLNTTTVTSSSYNANWNTDLLMCNTISNAITINLPPASVLKYKPIIIKCLDTANNVTINPNGSETIDGAATVTLTAYQSLKIISDGSNIWSI